MQVTFKNQQYYAVTEGTDLILQSVKQNVTFYGAYAELEKQAERAFEQHFPGEGEATSGFVSEFIEKRVEKYLDSIAIMGEVTVHNNN